MLNLLVSYAYMTPDMLKLVQHTQGRVRWLLDSGAFTAHQQGKPIDLDRYIKFVNDNGHLFWQSVALDVVGDASATKNNLRDMRMAGLNPMPVCTVDEHVDEMPALLGDHCVHLCIAGGASEPTETYAPRIAAIRQRVGDHVWLHGLGFARGLRVAGTRVNSVDASSWMAGQRWGQLTWFEDGIGVRNVSWREALKRPWRNLPRGAQQAIVEMGLTRDSLRNADAMQRGAASMLGVQSAFTSLQYAAALQQRGVKFFFAVPNVGLTMSLFVAATHAAPRSLVWDQCKSDAESVRALQLDRLQEYACNASDNATAVFGLT